HHQHQQHHSEPGRPLAPPVVPQVPPQLQQRELTPRTPAVPQLRPSMSSMMMTKWKNLMTHRTLKEIIAEFNVTFLSKVLCYVVLSGFVAPRTEDDLCNPRRTSTSLAQLIRTGPTIEH